GPLGYVSRSRPWAGVRCVGDKLPRAGVRGTAKPEISTGSYVSLWGSAAPKATVANASGLTGECEIPDEQRNRQTLFKLWSGSRVAFPSAYVPLGGILGALVERPARSPSTSG